MSLAPFPVSQHSPAAPVRDLSLQLCDEGNVLAEAFPPLRVQLLQLFNLRIDVTLNALCAYNGLSCMCSSRSNPHQNSLSMVSPWQVDMTVVMFWLLGAPPPLQWLWLPACVCAPPL